MTTAKRQIPNHAKCYGWCKLADGATIDMEGTRLDFLVEQIAGRQIVDIGESEMEEEAHWYITWGNSKEAFFDSTKKCNELVVQLAK